MNGPDQPPPGDSLAERLARAEARLARLEAHLQLDGAPAEAPAPWAPAAGSEDELELVVGQRWLGTVGILVLLLGGAFTLSLPYPALPAWAPSLIGAGVAAALVRGGRRPHAPLAGNLRGAALALIWYSAVRLCHGGGRPAFSAGSPAEEIALALAVALNLTLAWRWQSPWLAGLAFASGYAGALEVGTDGIVLAALPVLALVGMAASRRWPSFTLLTIALTYATYLSWALGDPWLGRPLAIAAEPIAALGVLLAVAALLAAAPLRDGRDAPEDGVANLGACFNAGAGYGLFLCHSLAAFGPRLVAAQAAASLVFLGLAVAWWIRRRSRVATFVYAMTGYGALSVAIIAASPVPQVFIWLSLQSLVVVATAIWFQSRFIIVANFLIYAAIVIAYMAIARVETGISLAFGVVALTTARILNWQRDRLELRTGLMRNAYLVSALVIFPYALYHLVPRAQVGLAWIGVALLYYGMNLIVRSQKYRWMGHATLLCTALYLVVVGLVRLEPLYRNLSFLVLGTVLLAVSYVFTRIRARRAGDPAAPARGNPLR
jgi:hypothetical protein